MILNVDPATGALIRAFGEDLFSMPHGITVDFEGNLWVTDVGRHQVIKLSRQGKVLLELGTKFEPGSDDAHFCKPTGVAVQSDGVAYVSDGYCNARVVRMQSSSGGALARIGALEYR